MNMDRQFIIEYYIRVGRYEKAASLIQNKVLKDAILDMAGIHNKYKRQQELLRELAINICRRTR